MSPKSSYGAGIVVSFEDKDDIATPQSRGLHLQPGKSHFIAISKVLGTKFYTKRGLFLTLQRIEKYLAFPYASNCTKSWLETDFRKRDAAGNLTKYDQEVIKLEKDQC